MLVKNRQSIERLSFRPPTGAPLGVDVMPLTLLHRRVQQFGHANLPLRPEFHQLIVVTKGELRQTVDFTPQSARAGEWLWVQPGQVNQWGDLSDVDGILILFEPSALDRRTATAASIEDPYAPVVVCPGKNDVVFLRRTAQILFNAFQTRSALPPALATDVVRHVLAVLVLRLAHVVNMARVSDQAFNDTFVEFRDAVERDFAATRRLEDYAARLGWSPRTLSRVTTSAVGVNAKRYIDDRVILEARRMLAFTDDTVAHIADQLGFSSPTNFTKFFRRATGDTPVGFRSAITASLGGPNAS